MEYVIDPTDNTKIVRECKGIWTPIEIWSNKELSVIEKNILGEIHSLDNGDGCFASNEYLASFFNTSKGRIANIISSLEQRGYIIKRKFDGRKRFISVDFTRVLKPKSLLDDSSNHPGVHIDISREISLDNILSSSVEAERKPLKCPTASEKPLPLVESVSPPQTPPTPITAPKQTVTWLTPYCDIWHKHFHGILPCYQIARPLKRLEKEYGAENVKKAWDKYCSSTEQKWASIHSFIRKPNINITPKRSEPITTGERFD